MPSSIPVRASIAALFVLLSCDLVRADTTIVGPDRDGWICETCSGPGTGPTLATGFDNLSDLPSRSLLHFDVASALPPGAIVNSVVLRLTSTGNQGALIGLPQGLYGLAEDWIESANWGQRIPPSVNWTTFGGTTNGGLTNTPFGTNFTFGSTPAFVARVQSWLDQPSTNYGVVAMSGDAVVYFASREHPTAAWRPQLEIDWTPGCTSTSYCVGAVNSRGTSASIGAVGSLSLAQNAFALSVTGGIPMSTLFFVFSDAEQQTPWGNGFLCLDGHLVRVLPAAQFNSTGSVIRPLDLATHPGSLLTPGTPWSFQAKYRDVAAGGALFNSTNAVRVTFCP